MADYASKNLEAMNPPLFLRFLNLLMNDAIFLLDEAIQYLSKIKIQQIEKDRGEWDNLTPEARREKEAGLQMFGQLARFHNIMSNETIGTLAFLTSGKDTKQCFPKTCSGQVLHHLRYQPS